jgi:hypothetical protein
VTPELECYVFRAEPDGADYADLIEFCCEHSTKMILVVRDPQIDPGSGIKAKLARLEPYLEQVGLAEEWPGTRLLTDKATLFRYRVAPGLQKEVQRMASRLFEWIHPDAPEDVCFLRSEGQALMVTTTHEHDAYLLLAKAEFAILEGRYPHVASLLQREGLTSGSPESMK